MLLHWIVKCVEGATSLSYQSLLPQEEEEEEEEEEKEKEEEEEGGIH